MRVQPASIDQIRTGADGRVHVISADVGGVADALRRIDPHLGLRFVETASRPYYVVFHESEDGLTHTLVLTAQECDHRIVEEVERRDKYGRGRYDMGAEVQAHNKRLDAERKYERSQRVQEGGELLAHAIRKDLGSTVRAFIPRDIPR